ncbi:ArsR/SmtB family transcription factor [Microbacterium sp. NPDC058345]|uniref:ArsR/SmtB family transcription factor n=1 Tax=Microbacterium sp. NPDC058345 TaxID=3346455 RepID=UPI00364DD773
MTTIEALPLRDLRSCCAPLTRAPLSRANAESLAASLKALADPTRLRILSMIAAHADGESCVCDLTDPLQLSQPTVSHHLRVLTEAGFLEREKRGTWAYFRIVDDAFASIAHLLGRD